MPKLSTTDRILIKMLTENTGRHMLDSGGTYGRNWERNQKRDFLAEPTTTFAVREYQGKPEFEITHNVFHWLRDRLDYDARLTATFKRFCKKTANKNKYDLELMEDFAELRRDDPGESVQTVNTYNGEDLLSQTLQYTLFRYNHDEYVLLQIHGGCDVRGGYTTPRVFRVMEEYAMYDNAKASVWEDHDADTRQSMFPGMAPDDVCANWDMDDGCHLYRNGSCGLGALPQLETYEISHDIADKGNGKIYLDDDGVAYGPVYGGKLCAGFM